MNSSMHHLANISNVNNTRPSFEIDETSIVYAIITICTVLTNVTVLGLIVYERKLHTMSNWIIASMFCAGIIFAVGYLLPRWVLFHQWRGTNPIACTVLPLTGIGLILNLNLHLCLVSFDRYFSITHPFKYDMHRNRIIAIVIVAAVWIVSIISSYLPLFTFMIPAKNECSYLQPANPTHFAYLISCFSIFFFIPLAVLMITYTQILYIVNNHTRRNVMFSQRLNTPADIITRNIRAIKHMTLVIGVFTLFWLPYVIAFLTLYASVTVHPNTVRLVRIFQYLAFTYPAINPILYSYFTASLRHEIDKRLKLSLLFSRKHTIQSSLRTKSVSTVI